MGPVDIIPDIHGQVDKLRAALLLCVDDLHWCDEPTLRFLPLGGVAVRQDGHILILIGSLCFWVTSSIAGQRIGLSSTWYAT